MLHLLGRESWHLAEEQAASGGEGGIFLLDLSFPIFGRGSCKEGQAKGAYAQDLQLGFLGRDYVDRAWYHLAPGPRSCWQCSSKGKSTELYGDITVQGVNPVPKQ